jgi:hypothetical protein
VVTPSSFRSLNSIEVIGTVDLNPAKNAVVPLISNFGQRFSMKMDHTKLKIMKPDVEPFMSVTRAKRADPTVSGVAAPPASVANTSAPTEYTFPEVMTNLKTSLPSFALTDGPAHMNKFEGIEIV